MKQNYSSNLKNPESTRDSLVWTWEERNSTSGWYSVQHASQKREYGSEDSGGPSNTHASGKRKYDSEDSGGPSNTLASGNREYV